MTEIFHHTEGIILRVIPFRDYDSILTLFTPDAGIIKILHKSIRSKKGNAQGICMPLTKVEVIYRETRGEIFKCHEMALIESFSFLRKEFLDLERACDLLQIVLSSQMMGKAAPHLYALLCFYLEKISLTANPWILGASFRLKLLRHEGLATFPFICSVCQHPLHTVAHTCAAEGWCEHHHFMATHLWGQNELEQLYHLAICQSYREICQSDVFPELHNKIKSFFEECVRGNYL